MPIELLENPVTLTVDETDRAWMSHIILEGWKLPEVDGQPDFVSENNSVIDGIVFGQSVKALCGFEWVPGKNPHRYPLCPLCVTIAKERGWTIPSA